MAVRDIQPVPNPWFTEMEKARWLEELRDVVNSLSMSGGGTSAGGSNTQIQYNNSGVLGGTSGLTWDGSKLSFSLGTDINEFSTDGTLAGDSDDAIPTEKAVKAYVDASSTAPGGSDTHIQYNNGGAFGGDSAFIFNDTSKKITATGEVRVGELAKTKSGTITRDGDGYITSVAITSGRTLTVTRDADDFITSVADGTNTWTLTRNASDQVTSWAVT